MRNVFDQYSQPENRITHALMTALHEDRRLLGRFLDEVAGVQAPRPPEALSVLEQQVPGELEPPEDGVTEQRGTPDGWIFDEDGWCVLIESKVLTPLRGDQLRRHRNTAERRGFNVIALVAIAPDTPQVPLEETIFVAWRDVYAWLRRHRSDHPWAARAAAYLEVAETKLIGEERLVEGTLTMFTGIPFGPDYPFTYLEGKRVLGLAMGELRRRTDLREELRVDPTSGRGAIREGRGDHVWDVLAIATESVASNFTDRLHLTLGITSSMTTAMVTVPNAVNTATRNKLVGLGEAGFQALVERVIANIKPLLERCTGAVPVFRGQQRRWETRSSLPVTDALIEFDLRAATQGGPPKSQPRWLPAGYGAFAEKGAANYEFQVGVRFPHARCPEVRTPEVADLIAAAWLGCKPLVDLGR